MNGLRYSIAFALRQTQGERTPLGTCMKLDLERLQGFGREHLLRLQAALREPLLVVIAQERVERMPVAVKAVRPPVLAQLAHGVLDAGDEPRQHRLVRGGLAQAAVGAPLRLDERLVER